MDHAVDEPYGDESLTDEQLLEHAELELADALAAGVVVLGSGVGHREDERSTAALDEVLQHFDQQRQAGHYIELVDQLDALARRGDEVTVRRERRSVARVLSGTRVTGGIGGAA